VLALVARYEGDVKKIKSNVLRMCWYMRGGVTFEEAMHMSIHERNIINKIVDENAEVSKKSGVPIF
jgi:hypothetical protein